MKKTICPKTETRDRDRVLDYAAQRYGTAADHPWRTLPGCAALRRPDNGKCYGLLMDVPREKLGLAGEGRTNVLELKCDPILAGTLRREPGILPSYHMHRDNWITVVLDGPVALERIFALLDESYAAAAPARCRPARRGREVWIMPANPRYFDLEAAFAQNPVVRWQQRVKAAVGDVVYLYVTAPVCAVLYRCKVVRADIPWHYDDGRIHTERGMDLELQQRYDPCFLPREKLQAYGVRSVRGPRHLPHRLACLLEEGQEEQ